MKKDFLQPVLYFSSTAFLGIIASLPSIISKEYVSVEGSLNAGSFYIGFFLATSIFLFLYLLNMKLFVRIWFNSAIFITTFLFFSNFFNLQESFVIAFLLTYLRIFSDNLNVKNMIHVISFAGIGSFFGILLDFTTVLVLLLGISIYDVLAVRMTKHMVFLAKKGMESDTLPGFIYEKRSGNKGDGRKEEIKLGALGGGDVVIPLIFSITLLKTFGIIFSITSIIFSILSLLLLFVIAEENKAYPALPFLSSGCLLGFIISYFLFL